MAGVATGHHLWQGRGAPDGRAEGPQPPELSALIHRSCRLSSCLPACAVPCLLALLLQGFDVGTQVFFFTEVLQANSSLAKVRVMPVCMCAGYGVWWGGVRRGYVGWSQLEQVVMQLRA